MNIEFPDVIILAGGLGMRLRDVVSDVPKSMAPIAGKPFLEYQLRLLERAGLKKVIFATGYLSQSVEQHFGRKFNDIRLEYSVEEEPLGTGGAVRLAVEKVRTPVFLVMNGDSLFRINFQDLFTFHLEKLCRISLALKPVDDAQRYGTVELSNEGQILSFREKQGIAEPGLINGGIYLMNKKYFLSKSFPAKFSLEKEFFPLAVQEGVCYGQPSDAYFLDIGIPEAYARAQTEFPMLF